MSAEKAQAQGVGRNRIRNSSILGKTISGSSVAVLLRAAWDKEGDRCLWPRVKDLEMTAGERDRVKAIRGLNNPEPPPAESPLDPASGLWRRRIEEGDAAFK